MNTVAGYELTVFAGAMASGVILAFLYDLFRVKRRFVRTSAIFIHIEDILFWVIAAIIVFLTSYIISSGETRPYFFSGVFLGGLVYCLLLSKMVLWALTALLEVFLWPVRAVIRFLKPVFRALLAHMGRWLGRVRNGAALKAYRIRIDMRRLRNAMTKK
jgi:spore cortex biosynthesis protein YabQ